MPIDVNSLNYNQRLYVAGLQQAQQQQQQLQQAHLHQQASLQHQHGLQHPNLPVGYPNLGRSTQPYPQYGNAPFLQGQQPPSYWQNKPTMQGGMPNNMPMPFLQNQSSGQNSKN